MSRTKLVEKPNVPALRRIFRHFGPHLAAHRKTLLIALLCMFGVTLTELLKPWPLKLIFDAILLPQASVTAWLDRFSGLAAKPEILLACITVSILLIAIFGGLFSYWQSYLTASVGQRVVAAIRQRLFSHVQRLSHSFHENTATGDLLARLTGDIRMLRELLVNAVIFISDRSLVVIAMLTIMMWMDWQLTLVALTILPLLIITVGGFSSGIKQATRKQRRRESQITHAMHEKLSAINVVQAFAREAYEEQQFEKFNNKSMKAGLVATRLEAHMNRVVQLVLALGTAGVIWFGVGRVQAGLLTPGDLLVFTAYLTALYKPIRKLSALTSRIAKATACGERVIAILETEPDIQDLPGARIVSAFAGRVSFAGVSFAYPQGQTVLQDVSFEISPGETVAIVGVSGAGKSTLVNLLLRFYQPQHGRILIDDSDIQSFTLESLRNQIAVVLQDSVLFNTTVRDNIAYGRLDADLDDIAQAARLANADEFISELTDGYDTVLSERGASLSGGQRQRIAIARAIIQNASIIVLDEPTASLDAAGKHQVEQALTHLTEQRSCIIITHDIEHARQADRVFSMHDNELRELDDDELTHNAEPRQKPVPLPIVASEVQT